MSEEKLPKGWKIVTISKIGKVVTGNTPSKGNPEYFNGNIPWVKPGDVKKGRVIFESEETLSELGAEKARIIPKGSVIVTCIGDLGNVTVAGKELASNQQINSIVVNESLASSKYIYYWALTLKSWLIENSTSTTISMVNKSRFENAPVLLPPLLEQQRIVAKLDAIFEYLDVLREKLDRIPVLLKNFRKQVLIKAVTGELTGDLEIADHFILESSITIGNEIQVKPKKWRWCLLTELARLESGHTPRKSCEDYWEKGNVPWISLQDIRSAHGKVINDTKYMPNQKGIENSSARMLPAGTVCFSRDISVGFSTIMGREMATSQHFANWICGENLSNKFLLYAFMASRDYLIGEGKGTTVGTIYMPALKQMHLLLPPLDIQNEIVKQLDALFDLADKIESQYQSLKAKIDQLPQAILAKAFRGELVGQEVEEYVREEGEVLMAAENLEP